MAKKLKVHFDKEYDILFVGLYDSPPSYGIDLEPRITKFVSIDDDSLTGIEITDFCNFKKKFSKETPFSSILNSQAIKDFVRQDSRATMFINV